MFTVSATARHALFRAVAMATVVAPLALLAACSEPPPPAPAPASVAPAPAPAPAPVVPKARG